MTEKELRAQVVAQAQHWLGRGEHDGSHHAILQVYNAIRPLPRGYAMRDSDPWCAAFVSAVGAACGLSDILYPECACEPMIARYQAAGRFEESDEAVPRPGDLIFYDWQDSGVGDCRGECDHVGLVVAVDGDSITTVEGNYSDKVKTRRLHVDSPYIRGYGKPDYLGKSVYLSGGTAAKEETPGDDGGVSLPVVPGSGGGGVPLALPALQRGDTGETVRAAQLLLIGRGCRCGPWGADGEFGPATQGSVQSYQRGHGLEIDGVIGQHTWASLLGA